MGKAINFMSVSTADTLDLDLQAASPGCRETLLRCGVSGAPLGSEWYYSALWNAEARLGLGRAAEEPGGGNCGQNFMALENGYCIYQ